MCLKLWFQKMVLLLGLAFPMTAAAAPYGGSVTVPDPSAESIQVVSLKDADGSQWVHLIGLRRGHETRTVSLHCSGELAVSKIFATRTREVLVVGRFQGELVAAGVSLTTRKTTAFVITIDPDGQAAVPVLVTDMAVGLPMFAEEDGDGGFLLRAYRMIGPATLETAAWRVQKSGQVVPLPEEDGDKPVFSRGDWGPAFVLIPEDNSEDPEG